MRWSAARAGHLKSVRYKKMNLKFSVKQFLVSVDQTINTLLGGWADESISSRAHRENPRLEKIIDTLFFWQKEHCRKSFQNEIDRMQFPPAFRDKPTV